MSRPPLTPRLVVAGAADAIAFYRAVFGARELERYTMPEGSIVQAALAIGEAVIALTDAAPDFHNRDPKDLGGSPVILSLEVDDPDATAAEAVRRGAKVIFPIADQFYGYREGRIEDPFGHVWILSKLLEELSPEEIQRRVDALGRE
jgi:uncharacterized glyoxalase superfamily protein PhnB